MFGPYMQIGRFIHDPSGVTEGILIALGITSTYFIGKPMKSKEGLDYFRLVADPEGSAYDIGAAFPKKKGDMTYYSVTLESPFLSEPITGAFFPDKSNPYHYKFIWNRPQDGKASPEVKASAQAELPLSVERRKVLPGIKRRLFSAGATP